MNVVITLVIIVAHYLAPHTYAREAPSTVVVSTSDQGQASKTGTTITEYQQ